MSDLFQGSPVYALAGALLYQAIRYKSVRREIRWILTAAVLLFLLWAVASGQDIRAVPDMMREAVRKVSGYFAAGSPVSISASAYLMLYRKCHKVVRALAKTVCFASVIGIVYLLVQYEMIPVNF